MKTEALALLESVKVKLQKGAWTHGYYGAYDSAGNSVAPAWRSAVRWTLRGALYADPNPLLGHSRAVARQALENAIKKVGEPHDLLRVWEVLDLAIKELEE